MENFHIKNFEKSQKKHFYDLDCTKSDLTRRDVFQEIKDSFLAYAEKWLII